MFRGKTLCQAWIKNVLALTTPQTPATRLWLTNSDNRNTTIENNQQQQQKQKHLFRGMATGSNSSGGSSGSGSATMAQTPKHTNRLASSKSPYLLQHAHNPVDWYPWGEEAFELARSEDKMIFLSVGYSTCHWCHVMEHESFENPATAAIMNKHFVNIKVDREERPDVDKVYMHFLLLSNRSGGWPMSVWLTPDLKPLAAGTYFPSKPGYGMPSFTTVLESIAKKWSTERETLMVAGSVLLQAMIRVQNDEPSGESFEPGSADEKLSMALAVFKQRYDQQHGGFGSEPKFPEVSRLNFLFHAYLVSKDVDVLDMVLQTLDHIGRGGINDHVFGGFARYATTRDWHNVHFEKMLYDQGQLMAAYANGYKLTRSEDFLNYADRIYEYIVKDLQHPAGGFYAGEDADSLPTHQDTKKVEGAFYGWTWQEVYEAFKKEAKRFENISPEDAFKIYNFHYDMKPSGNIPPSSDPHGNLLDKNILIVRGSEEDTCVNFKLELEQLKQLLQTGNDILHKLRDQRPRPHLDTKIICAWNGLVLSGLAKLANCGTAKREEYLKTAKRLKEFLHTHLYDAEKRLLYRSCYGAGGEDAMLEQIPEQIEGFLDDYAFLIKGLLDYYKASLDIGTLHWAKELQDVQDKLFWDDKKGGYFFSQRNAADVIVRLKEDHDGAEPSGNSVAARNLILLSHYFDEPSYMERSKKLISYFSNVTPFGYILPEMMSAMLLYENGLDLVAVVGPDCADTTRFMEICRKFYIPGMIIIHCDPQHPEEACNQRMQNKFKMVNGKTTVYICHDRVCRMPVTDPAKLEENLMANFFTERI